MKIVISKIELRTEGIATVTFFKKQFIAWENIDSVTWESGCGVSVKLKNGKWIKVPDFGHQSAGIANSIRAWINRTGPRELVDTSICDATEIEHHDPKMDFRTNPWWKFW